MSDEPRSGHGQFGTTLEAIWPKYEHRGGAWGWENRENRPEVWQLAFDWATDNGIDAEDFANFYLIFAHPDNDPEPFHIAAVYWSEG